MVRHLGIRGLIAAVLAAVVFHAGAVPGTFSYQAKLTDGDGLPLEGPHTIIVGIYEGGTAGVANSGTKLFEETAIVTSSDGVVNHAVGSGANLFGGPLTGVALNTVNDLFLQVAVDSAPNVILPRTKLQSVPFALVAAGGGGVPLGSLILTTGTSAPTGFAATGILRDAGAWVSRAPMLQQRRDLGLAALDGKLYAVGGRLPGDQVFPFVHVYDPNTNAWASTNDLATGRFRHGTVAFDDKIFAIGGTSAAFVPTASVEAYDTGSESWTPRSPLPVPLSPVTAVAFGSDIYAFSSNAAYRYTPATDTWTTRASSGASFSAGVAAGVANNRIYLFSPDNAVLEYNPGSNLWAGKGNFGRVGEYPCATSLDGRIFVFYRADSAVANPMGSAIEYDAVRNAWLGPVATISSRSGAGCAALNGRIHLAGGYSIFGGTVMFDLLDEFTPPGVYTVLSPQ